MEQKLCETEKCWDILGDTKFGPGPWATEPSRKDFRSHGFDCFVHRSRLGNWCGYVGVSRSHPAFGLHYSDIRLHHPHGGLTFSDKCGGHLCHAKPTTTWWLGFDCGHFMDLIPGIGFELDDRLSGRRYDLHDHYWTMDETIAETKRLAHELSQVTGHHVTRKRRRLLVSNLSYSIERSKFAKKYGVSYGTSSMLPKATAAKKNISQRSSRDEAMDA